MKADSHHGLIGCVEVGVSEKRRGLIPGREEKPSKVGVGHRRDRHLELRDANGMNGLLVLADAGAPHEELASGNEDALEGRLFSS
jgi:hypothetical protein